MIQDNAKDAKYYIAVDASPNGFWKLTHYNVRIAGKLQLP